MLRKLRIFISDLRHYFINLLKWQSVLWNDRNWGSDFVLDVLEFKLKDLRNGLNNYKNNVDHSINVREIDEAIALLNNIRSNYFRYEYQQYYDADCTWEDSELPGYQEFVVKIKSNNILDYFNKYKEDHVKMNKAVEEGTFEFCTNYDGDENKLDIIIAKELGRFRQMEAEKMFYDILFKRIKFWYD